MKLSILTATMTVLATITPAFAVTSPAPAAAPAPQKIETLTSGAQSGALFLNVGRVFGLYGDLIKKSKSYASVEKAVAQGCPDPSKDVQEIGISTDIENMFKSDFGAVVTGSINLGKTLEFLKNADPKHPLSFVPSMYRGVTLMTTQDGKTRAQVGAYDETTSLLGVSEKDEAPLAPTKSIVATLKGEAPSFAKVSGLSLPANYLANLSLKVPASLRDQAAAAGDQFGALAKLNLISASVVADDRAKDAAIEVKGTCDDEESATALKALADQLVGAAASGGSLADLARQIKVSQSGKTVTLSLVIPKAEIEKWAANF